jgi:hypothetical protein
MTVLVHATPPCDVDGCPNSASFACDCPLESLADGMITTVICDRKVCFDHSFRAAAGEHRCSVHALTEARR